MMMLFTNNASSRLYAAIDAVTTSIRVQAGDGGKFPSPNNAAGEFFAVTLEDRRSGQIEICNCTARSGDILNVQRGQEGTTAQAFAMGATVSNRLTAATMDFLAHAGATGPQGPQGDVGPTGPAGPTGPQGAPGTPSTIPGPKGDMGPTGPQGAQGPQGASGPQGATGPQGQPGTPGATGPAGPVGPEGPQGQAGTGINMKGQVPNAAALPSTGNQAGDAYVTDDTDHLWVWTEEGYWADMGNIVGPQGPIGPAGPTGPTGPQGPTGPAGQQGIPGPEGPVGPQGTTDWDDLTGVPATFPPTLPVPWTGVSGKPATFPPDLPIAWTDVSGKPATFPPTLPIAQSGITNLTSDLAAKAPLLSPSFTGDPTAPTPPLFDNDQSIATTSFVKGQGYAPLASPVFTGDPQAPTPATTDNDASIATSAFVRAAIAAYALSDAPADGLVYGRKNNNWATVIGGASTSDGPPAAPLQNGQLWWETDTGNLHIYYNDGNSSQWVQLTGQMAATSVNVDKITSSPADMLAGFKTGPARFVVNSQADGLGFNIFAAHRSGYIQYNGLDMSFATLSSPNLHWAINSKGDGSGTEVFTVDQNGYVVANGLITANTGFQTAGTVSATNAVFSTNGWFIGSGLVSILASTGAGTCYLRPNGYASSAGQLQVVSSGNVNASGSITAAAGLYSMGGYPAIYTASNSYYIAFNGQFYFTLNAGGDWSLIQNSVQTHWIRFSDKALIHLGPAYKPGGGSWIDSSDARIKNVLGDYDSGLEQINALRPVRFTYKGNDTDAEPSDEPKVAPDKDGNVPEPTTGEPTVPYLNSSHYQVATDEKQFVGLIAQEVEQIFPGMVSKRAAWIDGQQVEDLRDLDTSTLIFALINAVKQLSAKVEALEAARV